MHEGLVGVLNRRFVNCYYNTFNGPGADPTVQELFDRIGVDPSTLSYGAIIAPNGELVNSFGYSQDEFFQKIVSALADHPELTTLSDEEAAIIERAKRASYDTDALLAAAQVHLELLDFDSAEAICDRMLRSVGGSGVQRARMQAMKGHIALLDLREDRRDEARQMLSKINHQPDDIADDIAIDLIACDVSIAPTQGFYGGWKMDKSVAQQHAQSIEQWLESDTQSNRRGEMLFYLGLARLAQGDQPGANQAWRRHANELPEDRFALLSRLHHSEYVFSPTGKNKVLRAGGGNMIVDPRSNPDAEGANPPADSSPKLVELLQRIGAKGGALEVRDGTVFVGDEQLSDEDSKLLLEALFSGGASGSAKVQIGTKPKKID